MKKQFEKQMHSTTEASAAVGLSLPIAQRKRIVFDCISSLLFVLSFVFVKTYFFVTLKPNLHCKEFIKITLGKMRYCVRQFLSCRFSLFALTIFKKGDFY